MISMTDRFERWIYAHGCIEKRGYYLEFLNSLAEILVLRGLAREYGVGYPFGEILLRYWCRAGLF